MAGDLQAWMALPLGLRLARCLGGIALAAALYFAVLFASGLRLRDLQHRTAPP